MTFEFRMMNECGLQITEQIGIAFNFHVILGRPWIEAAERVFDHRPSETYKIQSALARGEHKQLAIVQLLAPVVVRDVAES